MRTLFYISALILSFSFQAYGKKKPLETTDSVPKTTTHHKEAGLAKKRKRQHKQKDQNTQPTKKRKTRCTTMQKTDILNEILLIKKEDPEEDPSINQSKDTPTPLGNLSVLPPAALSHIANFLLLSDAFSLGLASKETTKIFLSDLPTFFKSLSYQLFDSIQTLFAMHDVQQGPHFIINKVEQQTLGTHIQRLMEIIRILDDHFCYQIDDDAYKAGIRQLNRTEKELFWEGALNDLYHFMQEQNFERSQDYQLIHILLGQILRHMDGQKTTFELNPNIQESDAGVNAMVEMFFHLNNHHFKQQQANFKMLLLNLMNSRPHQLTSLTIKRLHSFHDANPNRLYHLLKGILSYILMHPGKNIDALRGFIQLCWSREANMVLYLKQDDSDAELMAALLTEAQEFGNEAHKHRLYTSYLQRREVDQGLVRFIIKDTHLFQSEISQFLIYKAYLRRESIDPELLTEIFTIIANFKNQDLLLSTYKTYLERRQLCPEIARSILLHAHIFQKQNYRSILYATYLLHTDSDAQLIAEIFTEIQSFKNKDKVAIYTAYFKQTQISPERVDAIFADLQNFRAKDKAEPYLAYLKCEQPEPHFIESIISQAYNFRDEYHKTSLFNAYLKLTYAAPAHISNILEAAQSFDKNHRKKLYLTYFSCPHANANQMALIIKAVHRFGDEWNKSFLYAAYLTHAHADPLIINIIITKAQNFRMGSSSKAPVYAAYIKYKCANPNIVIALIEEAKTFVNSTHKASVYAAYLEREDADLQRVDTLIEEAQSLHSWEKKEIYTAYIKRPDANPALIEQHHMVTFVS